MVSPSLSPQSDPPILITGPRITKSFWSASPASERGFGIRVSVGSQLHTPLETWFPGCSDGKESTCNVGDLGSIPATGRSPGGGHGYTLRYSCLENPMDRGAWWAAVHRVAKSQTGLRDTTSCFLPSAAICAGALYVLSC